MLASLKTERRVYRAADADVVEKKTIAAEAATPKGWHDDKAAALAAWTPPRKAEAPTEG